MRPYLVWDDDGRAEIYSIEELDRLVDQLTPRAKEDTPFVVDLHVNEEASLCIVVSREESHLEFYSPLSRPPVGSSVGPWDDEEPIEFTYRGQHSSVPRRYFVPVADAREALRRYFRTGTRPDNIAWSYG